MTIVNDVVHVLVENRAEELMVEGIFADYISDRRLQVRMCWTSSSAISHAETLLLTTPAATVALALNCLADPREFRTPIENILSRAAEIERWHVAVAMPDMTVWLLNDPKFAKSVNDARASGRLPTKADIAVFFKDWVQQPVNQFDRDEVSRKDAEFAALNNFIEKHVLSAATPAE